MGRERAEVGGGIRGPRAVHFAVGLNGHRRRGQFETAGFHTRQGEMAGADLSRERGCVADWRTLAPAPVIRSHLLNRSTATIRSSHV